MSDGSCLWFPGVYACVYVLYGGVLLYFGHGLGSFESFFFLSGCGLTICLVGSLV